MREAVLGAARDLAAAARDERFLEVGEQLNGAALRVPHGGDRDEYSLVLVAAQVPRDALEAGRRRARVRRRERVIPPGQHALERGLLEHVVDARAVDLRLARVRRDDHLVIQPRDAHEVHAALAHVLAAPPRPTHKRGWIYLQTVTGLPRRKDRFTFGRRHSAGVQVNDIRR